MDITRELNVIFLISMQYSSNFIRPPNIIDLILNLQSRVDIIK